MKLATQAIFRGHLKDYQDDKSLQGILQFIWEEIARVVNFNLDVAVIVDHTHAQRLTDYLAADYPLGTLFVESDRHTTYVVQTVAGSNAWVYVGGEFSGLLADKPTDLGVNDEGFLFYITLQNHLFRWTGTAWSFMDEEGGTFVERVGTPTSSGWQLCDGSSTDYLQISVGDIVATAFTTPDEVTAPSGIYHKGIAAYTGTINAASAGALSGAIAAATATNQAAATGITVDTHPDHIHDQASSLVTPDFYATDVTGTGDSARTGIQLTTGAGALSLTHTVNDPTHNHTQNSHTHANGTLAVAATGEPRNLGVLRYFRR